MAFLYRSFFFAATMALFFGAMPAQTQTTATLNVTARVVEECVISSAEKRRLARLVRQGVSREDLKLRCSKGVVSRVNQRMINRSTFRPSAPLPRRIDRRRVAKRTAVGRSDVFLTTVTY